MKSLMTAIAILGLVACTANADIVVNEFWADDAGGDDVEYIELYGTPGMSLDGLSLIIVDGDTSGSEASGNFRKVNFQYDLSGLMPTDGFFVLGAGLPTGIADVEITAGDIQNGSQTYAVVETSDITLDGSQLTQASYDAILANPITDAAATIDSPTSGDHTYFDQGVLDLVDGSYAPDLGCRWPNGFDSDLGTDWLVQSNYGHEFGDETDLLSTPGAVNVPEPATIALLAFGAIGLIRRR